MAVRRNAGDRWVPVRSIEAWELFSRAAVAIVTWLRDWHCGGGASVRQAVRGRR